MSHRALCVLTALALLPRPTASRSPWTAGWGFASAGLPPMPVPMRSFHLNRSIVGYFIANNTGLASPTELTAEVMLGTVGIGWNLDHLHTSPPGAGPRLETLEVQQAAALKQARPDVSVMVLRNTEVLSVFWKAFRDNMNHSELWLQNPPGSGKPIAEPWGSDGTYGTTVKYFLNFSNPETVRFWIDEYVAPALSQENIDGVYTDCSCGTAHGAGFTHAEAVGRQRAFDEARALASSKGKWFSAWVNVGPTPLTQANCATAMKEAIAVGADVNKTLQWLVQTTAPGYTVGKPSVAAFLIARGASAVLALPPYDSPIIKRPFSLDGVDANLDPGSPVGLAQVDGTTFSREYTKVHVSLDCSTFTANIAQVRAKQMVN